jgi:hypothetical protein
VLGTQPTSAGEQPACGFELLVGEFERFLPNHSRGTVDNPHRRWLPTALAHDRTEVSGVYRHACQITMNGGGAPQRLSDLRPSTGAAAIDSLPARSELTHSPRLRPGDVCVYLVPKCAVAPQGHTDPMANTKAQVIDKTGGALCPVCTDNGEWVAIHGLFDGFVIDAVRADDKPAVQVMFPSKVLGLACTSCGFVRLHLHKED